METADRPPWLVSLLDADGRAVGAGVLVGRGHVISCAHVIADPTVAVPLRFPFLPGSPTCTARVIDQGWFPYTGVGGGDLAVLMLEGPVPDGALGAPLRSPPRLSGRAFSAFGFPRGENVAREAHGVLGRASGAHGDWIQIDSTTTGWTIEKGFSGGPVWDESAQAVVGIVAMHDANRTGHILSISYLTTLWPDLGHYIGWRLDLDIDLRSHWLPRARGVEPDAEREGWFFTGRTVALEKLLGWLRDDELPRLAVVTGGPGSGKSALLAHLLVSTDPVLGDQVPHASELDFSAARGAFSTAVHAKGQTFGSMLDRLADAADVAAEDEQDLQFWLRERSTPFTVLIDALDEAATLEDARKFAALLRSITSLPDGPAIRAVVGVRAAPHATARRRVHEAMYGEALRLDLDSKDYLRGADVADYAFRRLLRPAVSRRPSPYQYLPDAQVRKVAQAVAEQANNNFLVTQLTSRWLTTQPLPDDPAGHGWHRTLPSTVGEALDRYLDQCALQAPQVRNILTALAFAFGEGLPRDQVWLSVCHALHPDQPAALTDLRQVFESAASFLVERGSGAGYPVYRLYHHAFDEHLRADYFRCNPGRNSAAVHWGIVSKLLPENGWTEAARYVTRFMADHAASAGRIDELIADADYLVHADQDRLMPALQTTKTPAGKLISAVYRQSHHRHRDLPSDERRQILALDAARWGAPKLLEELNRAGGDWETCWSTAPGSLDAGLVATLTGHEAEITGIALNGPSMAVTSSRDGSVRLWDLQGFAQVGDTIRLSHPIRNLAIGRLDENPIAVTCDDDQVIGVWNLTNADQIESLTDVTRSNPLSVAVLGKTVVIGGSDGSLHTWDLRTLEPTGEPIQAHAGPVRVVAGGLADGRLILMSGSSDETVRFWDPRKRVALSAPCTGHRGFVSAGAFISLGDEQLAITGSTEGDHVLWDTRLFRLVYRDRTAGAAVTAIAADSTGVAVIGYANGSVQAWDVVRRTQLGRTLNGEWGPIGAVAVAQLDGRPVALLGAGNALRIWDFGREPLGDPISGHDAPLRAVAVTRRQGRTIALAGGDDRDVSLWDLEARARIGRLHGAEPVRAIAIAMDREAVAVSGGEDGSIRSWDLTATQPLAFQPTGRHAWIWDLDTYSLNGRLIVVAACSDGTLRRWDADTRLWFGEHIDCHGQWIRVLTVADLDGQPIVITGGGDGCLRTWDLRTGRPAGPTVAGHSGAVEAVASGLWDGRRMALTGDSTGRIRMWDLASGGPAKVLDYVHAGRVNAVSFLEFSSRTYVVSGGEDGVLQVWRPEGRSKLTFPGPVAGISCGPSGEIVTIVAQDLMVHRYRPTWNVRPA